jgi:hypothetical protein
MVEVFGEEHGSRMFRKIGPWYARRFGPANVFNKRIVTLSSKSQFQEIMAGYRQWRLQFLDEIGRLKPNYRPAPLAASFMQDGPSAAQRPQVPVPKGPVENW